MALTNLTKVQTVGIGSNIEVVGVVTTGQFKSGTSNLHSTGIELTNLNVSGIATIGGNLSIGGTLTYQDVTNIDSVGLITARAGVNVSGGQLDVGSNIKLGNAGIITATAFHGDGSNLTGIAADKIFEGNTEVETVDAGGNGHIIFKTEGSEKARITQDGVLRITSGAGNTALTGTGNIFGAYIYRDTGSGRIYFDGLTSGSNTAGLVLRGYQNGTYTHAFTHISGKTQIGSGGNSSRITVATNGNIGVGAETGTDFSLLDGIVINTDNGDAGLLINSSSSAHNAYLGFSYGSGSGTSHNDQYSAYIGRVGDNTLILGTNNNIRQTIDPNGHIMTTGNVNIGRSSNAGEALTVRGPVDGDAIRIERAGSYQWFMGQDGGSNLYFKANTNKEVTFPAAGGIAFNGETASNNTLNDYEEGSWNPTYTTHAGNAGSVSYSTQNGYYVKIGHNVWVMIDITVSSASGMSGDTVIGGFPFQSNFRQGQGYYYAGTMNWYIQYHHSNQPVFTGWMMGNSSLMRIYNGPHWNNLSNVPLNTNGRMSFSLWYTTNS